MAWSNASTAGVRRPHADAFDLRGRSRCDVSAFANSMVVRSREATKPEPRIYHEFIDTERTAVVHCYAPSARVDVTVQLGGVSCGGGGSPAGPARYDFVMWKGPFEGRDPRELCREAIAFWQAYLDAIEEPTDEIGREGGAR